MGAKCSLLAYKSNCPEQGKKATCLIKQNVILHLRTEMISSTSDETTEPCLRRTQVIRFGGHLHPLPRNRVVRPLSRRHCTDRLENLLNHFIIFVIVYLVSSGWRVCKCLCQYSQLQPPMTEQASMRGCLIEIIYMLTVLSAQEYDLKGNWNTWFA